MVSPVQAPESWCVANCLTEVRSMARLGRASDATSSGYLLGCPNPMSSMYSMPVPPAFGLFLSPTPMVIFWILVVLTPAAVRSLSGIFHCVQAPVAAAAGSALADSLLLPALSWTTTYRPAGSLYCAALT